MSPLEAQVLAQRAYPLLQEFYLAISNSMEGDHPSAEDIINWLARYESVTKG